MHALRKLLMECLGRPPGARRALIVLTLLVLGWSPAPVNAGPGFCTRPLADVEEEFICANGTSRKGELRLFVETQALKALLAVDDVAELEREQAQWRRQRQAACEVEAPNEKPECYAAWASNRAIVLRRQVDYILKEGAATLSLRDLQFDVRWIADRRNEGAIVTQLRHGSRVLAEVYGPNRFDLLARAGNDKVEAIVIRAHKEGTTYAIVGRDGAPPEIWQYRLSRPWMKRPPLVEAQGERLEVREQAEDPGFGELLVSSTARLEWTPSAGWQMTEPYRARPPIPQPQTFFGGAGAGNDCTSVFESKDTVKLGNRSLTVGEALDGYPQWLLAFGCDALIRSGPRPFDLTSERQIGTASVVLSTEYNSGNGGFVDRHILADVPGQGVQVWAFPGGEPANGTAAVAASFGYLFMTPADPGSDGGIYRWTPSDGFTFEGYQVFTPLPHSLMPDVVPSKADEDSVTVTANLLLREEVYRAFASASGPSVIGLSSELASGDGWSRTRLERQWAPELAVFTDCDGSRFCNHSGRRMIGVFVEKTRQFYFAFSQAVPGRSTSLRPAVWEYHPPLELWPQEAVSAVASLLDDRGILSEPDND